jgi:hypothetical protein
MQEYRNSTEQAAVHIDAGCSGGIIAAGAVAHLAATSGQDNVAGAPGSTSAQETSEPRRRRSEAPATRSAKAPGTYVHAG